MLFGKKKEEPAPQPVVETPVPQAEEPEIPEVKEPEKNIPMNKTMIGSGITFFGNFETADPMEINGTIIGNIKSSSSVSITRGARLNGDATMKALSSEGTIDGNLVVEELSCFSETAVTDGTLSTRFLETGHGSAFLGELKLGGSKSEEAAAVPASESEGFVSQEEPSFDADAFAQAAEELQGFVSEPAAEAPVQDDGFKGFAEGESGL